MSSSSSSAVTSVLIAAAQSVAKVYVIGAVGYLAVHFPRKLPFLPRSAVGLVARFTFHCFTLPLIYSTIALSVTIDTLGDYWFVLIGGLFVLMISFVTATAVGYVIFWNQRRQWPLAYDALRVASTFPNIVALPILIFPSLCEYSVVQDGYVIGESAADDSNVERTCVAQANTMIFLYFFAWSFLFWSLGYPHLLASSTTTSAASTQSKQTNPQELSAQKQQESEQLDHDKQSAGENTAVDANTPGDHDDTPRAPVTESNNLSAPMDRKESFMERQEQAPEVEEEVGPTRSQILREHLLRTCKQTFTSPGFIAMMLGFVTACLPPLQKALFEAGGPLRFLGAALEGLGMTTSTMSTIVVAASIVPAPPPDHEDGREEDAPDDDEDALQENPAMTDPNFGPYQRRRSSLVRLRQSINQTSHRALRRFSRRTEVDPGSRRLHIWFNLSRLVLTPAVCVAFLVGLECGTNLLVAIPPLAKLVVLVNSALPGALIVVVLLKGKEEMAEMAATVAKVYLPSYVLSIVTIAAWTAVAMLVTLPDDDGKVFCHRG